MKRHVECSLSRLVEISVGVGRERISATSLFYSIAGLRFIKAEIPECQISVKIYRDSGENYLIYETV